MLHQLERFFFFLHFNIRFMYNNTVYYYKKEKNQNQIIYNENALG